jgi:hypothetical protein
MGWQSEQVTKEFIDGLLQLLFYNVLSEHV